MHHGQFRQRLTSVRRKTESLRYGSLERKPRRETTLLFWRRGEREHHDAPDTGCYAARGGVPVGAT